MVWFCFRLCWACFWSSFGLLWFGFGSGFGLHFRVVSFRFVAFRFFPVSIGIVQLVSFVTRHLVSPPCSLEIVSFVSFRLFRFA